MARDRPLKYLLDTNIVSELRKGVHADAALLRWVSTTTRVELATSVLVLAEIRRGIELKRRKDRAQAGVFDRWYKSVRDDFEDRVLSVDEKVANAWVELNVPDRMQPIDGLIGATAKVHGLVLVTRNIADFNRRKLAVLNPFGD